VEITFEFSTDQNTALSFYKRVKNNILMRAPSEDGERLELQRCYYDHDLFSIRGTFLGCVYAETEGRIAGLFCITQYKGRASVDSGYVASKFRTRGIGAALLKNACDKLIERGKLPIHMIVRSTKMDRLIDRLGYPHGTVVKDDVANDLDEMEDCLFTEQEEHEDC
jgi:ribosomal protein S18 acetylase RimI-like enzyme